MQGLLPANGYCGTCRGRESVTLPVPNVATDAFLLTPLNSRLKPHVHSRVPRSCRRWRRCGQIFQEPTGCSGANCPEEWRRQGALHGYRRAICLKWKEPDVHVPELAHTQSHTSTEVYKSTHEYTTHTHTTHRQHTHTHTHTMQALTRPICVSGLTGHAVWVSTRTFSTSSPKSTRRPGRRSRC